MDPTQYVQWRRIEVDQLQNRSKHTATLVNDSSIVIAFGETKSVKNTVEFHRDIVTLNTNTNEVTNYLQLDKTHQRSGHAAISLGNQAVIIGGWAGRTKIQHNYLCIQVDHDGFKYQSTDEVLCGAHGLSATLLTNSDKVLVFGGKKYNKAEKKTYASSELCEWDVTTSKWYKIAYRGVILGRTFHSAVSPDPNTLIIQGGKVEDKLYANDPQFYKYDRRSQLMMPIINRNMLNYGAAEQWLDDVHPRESHTMNGYFNNSGKYGVIIYGGTKDSISKFPSWAEFDETYDHVTQHYVLPTENGNTIASRSAHASVLVKDKLYIIGGKYAKKERSKGVFALEGTPVKPPPKTSSESSRNSSVAATTPIPKVQFSKVAVVSNRNTYKKTVTDEMKMMNIDFKPSLATKAREERQLTPYKIVEFLGLHFNLGLQKGQMQPHPLEQFSVDEIVALIDKVEELFKKEPACLELPLPLKLFGDIHGQIADLFAFFKKYGSPIESHAEADIHLLNYAFLGDFVDRGQNSFEVICLLYSLKILYPEKVFLIRGNHEEAEVNEIYGFLKECQLKYGDGPGKKLWQRFNESFNWMPLGALIQDKILCVHGGVGARFTKIEQLRGIQRPIKLEQSDLLRDILWADPSVTKKGVIAAPGRGERVTEFGRDVSERFCKENDINLIIRAHQCVAGGIERPHPKVLTVFSATNYCGVRDNKGAVIIIDSNMVIHTRTIAPTGQDVWTEVSNASPPNTPRNLD